MAGDEFLCTSSDIGLYRVYQRKRYIADKLTKVFPNELYFKLQ